MDKGRVLVSLGTRSGEVGMLASGWEKKWMEKLVGDKVNGGGVDG